MKYKFLTTHEKYDGTQLQSLRNYLQHGLLGDSCVAWVGPCDVSFEHMVDGEDLLEKAAIRGERMLHFIIEKFDINLFAAVAIQRLFAGICKDHLQTISKKHLMRKGDDIFADDRKLSISIASQSPVSSLIHFAMNVNNNATPVKTLSLDDLGVEPQALAMDLMKFLSVELEEILEATHKVRWIK